MQIWHKIKEWMIEYRARHSWWFKIKHLSSVFIGFVLSPLSWWNDIFVNIPLSWVMTWVPLKLISVFVPVNKLAFFILFIINYWITNLVGMMMMHHSTRRLAKKTYSRTSHRGSVIVALLYTAFIGVIFYLNPQDLLTVLNIIPDWVN